MEWFKNTFGLKNSATDLLGCSPPNTNFVFTEDILVTTTNGRISLYNEVNDKNLQLSWDESPLDTIKIIFMIRNCRGGKGEKSPFEKALHWLIDHGYSDIIRKNYDNIAHYGCYKDYWYLLGTELEDEIIEYYANILKQDIERLEKGDLKNITLAGKWAPSDHCHHDKKFRVVGKLCKKLNITKAEYRKNYLRPLRDHLHVVESFICCKNIHLIDYSRVPSKAMNKYKQLFEKYDNERFKLFSTEEQKHENLCEYISDYDDLKKLIDGEDYCRIQV